VNFDTLLYQKGLFITKPKGKTVKQLKLNKKGNEFITAFMQNPTKTIEIIRRVVQRHQKEIFGK